MDLLFKNTTKYTKQLYLNFLNFHNINFGLKYHLFSLFVIIILLIGIIFQLVNMVFIPAITLIIFLVGFIIYRYHFSINKVSDELKTKKISNEKEVTFCFYDDHIEVPNENEIIKLKYRQIYRIFEMQDLFYIYINKEVALLVSKNGFTIGNYLDFSDFLKKKCHMKYKEVQI